LRAGGDETPLRPNILLIVSDDQRPDTIAALGNPHIQTPHLDDLVRRGTVFTRAISAHPLCYPSRAELLTGCTGWRNGSYSSLKLNDVPLLPKVLREAGYHTCYVGKWHTAGRPSTVGYEETDGLFASGGRADSSYIDFRGRSATGYRGSVFQTDDRKLFLERGVGLTPNISGEFADAAIRLIRKQSQQPFFVHVNFTAPHDPRIWPPGYEKVYDPAKMPLPRNFLGAHPFDHGNTRGRDEVLLPFPRTADDVRQELACYYAVISHMDRQIGRILAALDAAGQRDNTIVIFTSDHGLAIGSHGLVGKQNMYEHTIGVPLVVAGPGIPAGKRVVGQCYLRDLFPTLCDLAGITAPETDSRSLVPLLSGDKQEVHPFVVGYFQDSQRMIREGDWKLVWYPKIDRWQLFNVQADPDELRDLIAEQAQTERIADLRGKLTAWLKEHGDPLRNPEP
jgi:arylsulfatase A-like enzyme